MNTKTFSKKTTTQKAPFCRFPLESTPTKPL